MNFTRSILLLVIVLVLVSSCRRTISPEEHVARTEVRRALQQRSFAEATGLARRVLMFAPHDDGAWARLAQAQFGARDLAGLHQTLSDWPQAVPRTGAKYDEYRGDLARAEGRPVEAVAAWKKAVAQDRRPRIYLKIARLEQADAHWAEAALAWTRGMKEHETASALVNRAICYRHLHSWEAARADLRRAEAAAPENPIVRRESALFTRLEKFLAEIRDLDRQLLALPNDAETFGDRALLFLRAGDAGLAFDDATAAARLAPMTVRPQLLRALAEQALGRTVPRGAAPVDASLRLEQLAPEFLQTIRRLDQEIATEPESAELHTHRAWQLNEIGQPQLALADAQSALQSDARSAGACAEASYALAKLKRAPEAFAQIKHATELDPNFSTAWQYRGELEMGRADYTAAIESLSRALAINQTVGALAKREECYRKVGLLANAESDQKALEELTAVR